MERNKIALVAVVAVIAVVAVTLFSGFTGQVVNPGTDNTNTGNFAECLTDRGVKMYGAYWCPHCQNQKNMFGSDWENVNYIECSLPERAGQTEECRNAGIKAYPTWEFQDGTRLESELTFKQLSAYTGCSLE